MSSQYPATYICMFSFKWKFPDFLGKFPANHFLMWTTLVRLSDAPRKKIQENGSKFWTYRRTQGAGSQPVKKGLWGNQMCVCVCERERERIFMSRGEGKVRKRILVGSITWLWWCSPSLNGWFVARVGKLQAIACFCMAHRSRVVFIFFNNF